MTSAHDDGKALGGAARKRLALATRALEALRRPPGEQALTEEQYDRLAEVIRKLDGAAGPAER